MEQNKFTWPLINNNITEDDKSVLIDFIKSSDRFTNGPAVKEFEAQWSEWLGVKHSVMVNSGASGNYISIAMVKEITGPGEVIVPPIGWVSDIASVVNLGMTPVFVDVDMGNFSMTLENIKSAITPRTKAIVLVHAMGFNAMVDELITICKEKGICLIEDCCESHGAKHNDQKVGSMGDISIFSFYYGHHITTIEGGMVCVNNPKLYDLAKLFRSHGMTREASQKVQDVHKEKYPDLNPLFTFAVPGFNMRSTELNAVLGINQLKRLDAVIEKRRQNLDVWLKNLDGNKFFVSYNTNGNSSFALPLIMQAVEKEKLKDVCKILEEQGVEYRLGTAGGGNQARQPYLKKYEHSIIGNLPVANYIHDYSLYIGNHTDLFEEQIIDLTKKLNEI